MDARAGAGLLQISSAGKTVSRQFELTGSGLVHPVRAGPFAAFARAAQVLGDLVRTYLEPVRLGQPPKPETA